MQRDLETIVTEFLTIFEQSADLVLEALKRANAVYIKAEWRPSGDLLDFYYRREGQCFRSVLVRGEQLLAGGADAIFKRGLPCDHEYWKDRSQS